MSRCLVALAVSMIALLVSSVAVAQDKKEPPKLTVNLFASLDDETLQKAMPVSGVIASEKAWATLAKDWKIEKPAKVDFSKEVLVVATTVGSRLNLSTKLDDAGDLKLIGIATRDLRPGFRYAIKSVSRDGVKSVNGKPLPKE